MVNEIKTTRVVEIGNRVIGGGNPVLIQSMTNTKTEDVKATVAQIKELERAGCDIIRCAVPTMEAALAFKEIKEAINIRAVVDVAKEYQIPIRVGVNSGSLEKEVLEKYGKVTSEALVESALNNAKLIEDMDYHNLVISIKSSNVMECIKAHELIATKTDIPLHVGITESGSLISGNIKSGVGLGIILYQGIGDTIRVSLTGNPVEEIKSAKMILKALGLRKGGAEIVSCPTCGRTDIDLIGLEEKVNKLLEEYMELDIKVAVMGCVVNGPGEAREADLGICGGKNAGLIIKKGEIIKRLPESELLMGLKEELDILKAKEGK